MNPAGQAETDDAAARRAATSFDRAEAELRAAATLLALPPGTVPTWTASRHLVAAGEALLAGLSSPAPASELGTALLFRAGVRLDEPPDDTLGLVAELQAHSGIEPYRAIGTATGPSVERLLEWTRALEAAIGRARRAAPLRSTARRRQGLLWLRVAGLALVAAALLAEMRRPPDIGSGPFRALYYTTEKFQGSPVLRREPDLSRDFAASPPPPEMRWRRFAARWDTCLVVPQRHELAFTITTSSGGARLLVDGEVILEAWHAKLPRGRTGKVVLEPGTHAFRLEFQERKRGQNLAVVVSVDGAPPADLAVALPPAWLRYPGDEAPLDDICGALDPEGAPSADAQPSQEEPSESAPAASTRAGDETVSEREDTADVRSSEGPTRTGPPITGEDRAGDAVRERPQRRAARGKPGASAKGAP